MVNRSTFSKCKWNLFMRPRFMKACWWFIDVENPPERNQTVFLLPYIKHTNIFHRCVWATWTHSGVLMYICNASFSVMDWLSRFTGLLLSYMHSAILEKVKPRRKWGNEHVHYRLMQLTPALTSFTHTEGQLEKPPSLQCKSFSILTSRELLLFPGWGLSYYYLGIYLTTVLWGQTTVNTFLQCKWITSMWWIILPVLTNCAKC